MADQNIIVRIGADISDLIRGIRDATRQLGNLSERTTRGMEALGGLGKVVTGAGVALSAGLGAAVKTAADFDTAMRKAGAIAGANTKQFNEMRDAALDLGAKTSMSSSQVAEAMTELAAKGFDANQTIAAMPGIIAAAEASGEDLALTSDTVASALNGFEMAAGDANHVADVLAMSANKTAAGVVDMQYAFKYAAPIANSLGVSLEELASATGIMSNAGIKGEQAGTTLRGGLIQLLKPAEQTSKLMDKLGIEVTDSKGKFIGLSGVIKNFQESMKGMTDTQKLSTLAQIVGTEAASGFLTLMQAGPKKIDAMTKSLEKSDGAAAKASAEMKAGIGGTLQNLQGAFESLAIIIGTALIPSIQKVATWLSNLANWFNGLPKPVQTTIATIAALTAVFALLAGPILMVIGSLPGLIVLMQSIAGLFGLTAGALVATIGAIAGVVAGVALLATAAFLIYKNWTPISKFFENLWARISRSFSSLMPIVDKVKEKFASFGKTIKGALSGNMSDVTSVFSQLIPTIIGLLVGGLPGLLISLSKFLPAIANFLSANLPKIISAITKTFEQISTSIEKYAPIIIQSIVNGISTGLPIILNSAVQIITTLINGFTQALPMILGTGVLLLTTILNGIVSALPIIINAATQVITMLVNTITQLLPTIINTGITLLTTLLNGIISALPTIINAGIQILMALIQGIVSLLPSLIDTALTLIMELINALLNSLPMVIDAGIKLLTALITGIVEVLPQLVATAIALLILVVDTLVKNLPKIIEAGVKLVKALIDGIIKILPELLVAALKLIVEVAGTLIKNLPTILKAGVELVWALIKGILSIIGEVAKSAKEIGGKIIEKLKEVDLLQVGKDIIRGLIKGLGSMGKSAWEAVQGVGESIKEGFKSFFKIHSPSRVMRDQVGVHIGTGLAKGIEKSTSTVKKASSAQAKAALTAQQSALKKINSGVLSANNSFLSKFKSLNKKLTNDINKANSDYKKALSDRENAIYNQVGLFDKIEPKAVTKDELTANLKNQVQTIQQFTADIAKLGKRAPKAFVDELREMGIDSAAEVSALTRMSKPELDAYVKLWKQKHAAANTEAATQLADLKLATIKKVNELRVAASGELTLLKNDYIRKLQSLSDEVKKLGSMRKSGKVLGKNTVAGITEGLNGMTGALKTKAQSLANTITKTIKSALKIHSPSRLMRDLIGTNIVAGIIRGMENMKGAAVSTAASMAEWVTPQLPNVSMAYDTPTYGTSAIQTKFPSAEDTYSHSETINLDRMFAGANITLANGYDTKTMMRDAYTFAQQRARGKGRRP